MSEAVNAIICFTVWLGVASLVIWDSCRWNPRNEPVTTIPSEQQGQDQQGHEQPDSPIGYEAQNRRRDREDERHKCFEKIYWFSSFFVTAFALGGAIWGVMVAKSALKASQDQAGAAWDAAQSARLQSENMDRPWIKLVSLEHAYINYMGPGMPDSFHFAGERAEAFLNITPDIKNVGKTTAVHIHARIKFVIHKWENGWGDFSTETRSACSEAQAIEAGYDMTLFPDDPFDGVGTGDGVFLDGRNVSVDGYVSYIAPAIVGCVDYQFASSKKHHQTRFVFEVFRSDNRTRVFPLGVTAKEADITLIRDAQYDFAD